MSRLAINMPPSSAFCARTNMHGLMTLGTCVMRCERDGGVDVNDAVAVSLRRGRFQQAQSKRAPRGGCKRTGCIKGSVCPSAVTEE